MIVFVCLCFVVFVGLRCFLFVFDVLLCVSFVCSDVVCCWCVVLILLIVLVVVVCVCLVMVCVVVFVL